MDFNTEVKKSLDKRYGDQSKLSENEWLFLTMFFGEACHQAAQSLKVTSEVREGMVLGQLSAISGYTSSECLALMKANSPHYSPIFKEDLNKLYGKGSEAFICWKKGDLQKLHTLLDNYFQELKLFQQNATGEILSYSLKHSIKQK